MKTLFAFFLLTLILVASFDGNQATYGAASPAQARSDIARFKVAISPPSLPADGGVYHAIYVELQNSAGQPVAAQTNMTLLLTSSVLQVGSVEPTGTIPAGQTYAVASFYTTSTPGATNITVSANGVISSSAKVTTVSPSGLAVKLGVFASPSTLLPQAGSTGKVFVQLLDAGGKPSRAASTVTVSLASSGPNVADVTPTITIQKGQTYGTATTTAGFTAGITTITAAASGLATGFTQVSVEGQNPSKLYVKVAPDVLAANTGEFAIVAVQLQSQNGTPTPAPANITAHITSSNTTVGIITTNDITIQAGKTFATGYLLALARGTTIVSATTQSYASGFFTVTVVKPGSTAKGGVLALISALPAVLADMSSYPIVVAQLRNSSGAPSLSSGNVYVALAASNTFIGTIQSSLTIRAGRSFNVASFNSTLAPGQTNITALASNFVPASVLLTSAGPVPYRLTVILGPPLLIANGSAYATTTVQLQDASGNPARAPSDIVVALSSSSTEIGDVVHAIKIPAGRAHGYVTFDSTLLAGVTQITATAPGYVSGQTAITTVPPAASRLNIYVEPQALPADGEVHPNLVVQLQDQSGSPVKADRALNVTLSSSNPAVVNVDPRVTIQVGDTFAITNLLVGSSSGNATITAQAPGLTTASASPQIIFLPLSAVLAIDPKTPATALVSARIYLNASSGPYGIAGVNVKWSADSGAAKIANASSVTDRSGVAVASVNFADAGNVTISASISKGGYGVKVASLKLKVQAQQMSLAVIPDSIDIPAGGATAITAILTSKGRPVAGVSVTWSATLGNVNPPIAVSDAQGRMKVNFASPAGGTANVTASVSGAGYGEVSKTVQITVGGGSGAGSALGIVPYLAVPIIAIGAFLFVRRRRKALKEPKAGEVESEEGGPEDEDGEE